VGLARTCAGRVVLIADALGSEEMLTVLAAELRTRIGVPADMLAIAACVPDMARAVARCSPTDRVQVVPRSPPPVLGPRDILVVATAMFFVLNDTVPALRTVAPLSDGPGRYRVLYSNHSSMTEMLRLVDLVRPLVFAPLQPGLPTEILAALHGRLAPSPAEPRLLFPPPPPCVAAFMGRAGPSLPCPVSVPRGPVFAAPCERGAGPLERRTSAPALARARPSPSLPARQLASAPTPLAAPASPLGMARTSSALDGHAHHVGSAASGTVTAAPVSERPPPAEFAFSLPEPPHFSRPVSSCSFSAAGVVPPFARAVHVPVVPPAPSLPSPAPVVVVADSPSPPPAPSDAPATMTPACAVDTLRTAMLAYGALAAAVTAPAPAPVSLPLPPRDSVPPAVAPETHSLPSLTPRPRFVDVSGPLPAHVKRVCVRTETAQSGPSKR
jgi:hypothetical protein